MIQPNELRIGNLVNYNDPLLGEKHIVRITGILSNDKTKTVPQIWYENEKIFGSTSNLYCFDPITLTEDILSKCRFIIKDSVFVYDGLGLKLMNINNHYFRANFPIKADMIYFHQLQNLFHSLTNKELEVEL